VPQTAHSTEGAVGGYMSVALQPVHLRRGFIGLGMQRWRSRWPTPVDCSCQEDRGPPTYLACAVTAPHLAHSTAADLRRRRRRQAAEATARMETVRLAPAAHGTHGDAPRTRARRGAHPEGNISMAAHALHCPWNSRGGPAAASMRLWSPHSSETMQWCATLIGAKKKKGGEEKALQRQRHPRLE
jgi:hypothetical protein